MNCLSIKHRPTLWLLMTVIFCPGCVHGLVAQRAGITSNAIPARRLPDAFKSPAKASLVPVDFTQLRRPPVQQHYVGAGDVLGIHIEDVLGNEKQLPNVSYPPTGDDLLRRPSVGHPITVQVDGNISLPLLGKVPVEGLTLQQTVDAIQQRLVKRAILSEPGLITVDLIRPRSVKVFVIREDADVSATQQTRREAQVTARRGSADALEMTVFENDVLHALSSTGGLPGTDAFNEIWVLRGSTMDAARRHELLGEIRSNQVPEDVYHTTEFVRIPLRVCPGQELPFGPEDVILNDGDVVFIESRDIEYFMTGGLLAGGTYPIPRDHDVDILEAIAIANSSTLGPAGSQLATNFRSGPGNIVAPTDAVIVRRLPSGEQIKILVDLRIAVNNPQERVTIMPQDLILLRYKPSELAGNIALNFVNFNFAL